MTVTARSVRFSAVLAIGVTAVLTAGPACVKAAVGAPQVCAAGSVCTVGEFLYNDEYTPELTGTCTLTARYPNGSLYLNSQAMLMAADGWYYHEFTAPATTGNYRAQMCCTVGSDYLCADKSFEVAAASSLTAESIASAVWNSSNRTLTGFGSLVSDIWSYSSRGLTSFGTLAQDVWSRLPKVWGGRVAVESKAGEIEALVRKNRELLEKLVNKPVVEQVMDEEPDTLSQRLKDGEALLERMKLDVDLLVSDWGLWLLGWGERTAAQLWDYALESQSRVKVAKDRAVQLAGWWDWEGVKLAELELEKVERNLSLLAQTLKAQEGGKLGYAEAKQVLAGLEEAARQVERSGRRLAEVAAVSRRLEELEEKAVGILGRTEEEIRRGGREVSELTAELLRVNRVVGGESLLADLTGESGGVTAVKNRLLAVRGLIKLNKKVLVGKNAGPEGVVWLEEGSIVFKSVATNPSSMLAQEASIDYLLPPELKEEHILSVDEGLKVGYDAERDRLRVRGVVLLKPEQVRVVTVKTEDLWRVDQFEFDTLAKQARALERALQGSAFMAQGTMLVAGIESGLQKARGYLGDLTTPERRIKAVREAQMEMGKVMTQMEKLKDLATQAGAAKSLMGFVGGAQLFGVWGILVAVVAGVVFLAVFMKKLWGRKAAVSREWDDDDWVWRRAAGGSGWRVAMVLVISSALTVAVGRVVVTGLGVRPVNNPVVALEDKGGISKLGRGGPDLVMVIAAADRGVNLRQMPGEGEVEHTYFKSVIVERLEVRGEWVKVMDDKGRLGWVEAARVYEGRSEE